MGDVNFNFFNSNATGIRPDFFANFNSGAMNDVNDILSEIFTDFSRLFDTLGGNQFQNQPGIRQGGCCLPPQPDDGVHPSGSLTTDGGVITTPGGYKIEPLSQFEWKITGPDGKETRVWGDPHVAEGDGGKWDFKRNSTFVLGDGTKVNVNTAPYGDKGMTVTSGLEIISGNDRITVSGINKGKGVVGEITQDGYAHANSFAGDVFVMGNETDDWSLQGREITGSNNGGDSFQLGNNLAAGNTKPVAGKEQDWVKQLGQFVNNMIGNWSNSWKPNNLGSNPYYDGLSRNGQSNSGNDRTNFGYDRGQHQNQVRDAFRMLGQMFNMLARLSSMSDRMNVSRNRTMYA
ncbi:MAG: DUF1521 domain-containing protein [Acidobacteriota bacterium]|nr:DUF1521 domain-containing protein [Acidobacteriota bacterium]